MRFHIKEKYYKYLKDPRTLFGKYKKNVLIEQVNIQ